jgi:hypothetical protein
MANLLRINNISLYLSFDSLDSYYFKKELDNQNIPYELIQCTIEEHEKGILEMLSSMTYGEDFAEYNFDKFPVATWREYYDDYERWIDVADTLEELKNSNIFKHKDLIR